ncbi:hypothetical protein HAV21_09455 [Paenarthrobacter sp. MSM-2-10-13]|uniref:hypothetical protein n=1 Tax=Paenarthrobacter sp. MSM-2-10-13 TaxID=2717318 RepID=UPI0014232B1C|nr:hypothetical protein [Paenarthrobacter sp. MSM-2-10-13]NHW47116.1 hypothetical protein [Paenarthrobacter sp. MSM-2-10-13]
MSGWEWAQIIANLATVIAVTFAIIQLIGARAAKHRDFENLYVQRFWALMDNSQRSQRGLVKTLRGEDRTIRSYLELCEDELDLRRNGFISTKTLSMWADGMIKQCSQSPYKEAMKSLGPSELPALQLFLLTQKDPLKMSWIRKWWTGIGIRGPRR